MQSKNLCCVVVVVILLAVISIHQTQARPSRMKRVSDQRLAEIETLLALSKYKGMLSTVPVGYGKIDYHKIGRRRRAANLLWRELLDESNEPDSADMSDDSEELVDQPRENYRQLGDEWGRQSTNI